LPDQLLDLRARQPGSGLEFNGGAAGEPWAHPVIVLS
jgi:hypothetical protein